MLINGKPGSLECSQAILTYVLSIYFESHLLFLVSHTVVALFDEEIMPIFFDTETCGFHGPIVLLQWARNDGPVHLHNVWKESPLSTIKLIEEIATDPEGIVGFNLSFDWFHICQLYTTLLLLPRKNVDLEDQLETYADLEPQGRDGPCVKPAKACDLMLHARRGPYQSTMDRSDIRIRRVPTPLAFQLAKELEQRVKLKDIYFAKRKDKFASKWRVYDLQDEDGDIDPDFKDVLLKFKPSSALKALASDALNLPPDTVLLFTDVEVDRKFLPKELGYAPFAKALWRNEKWNGAWPDVIRFHISHWSYHELARKYAEKDVTLTRELYKYFGEPALGDDDSELACMVGAVRWRGFKLDLDYLKKLRSEVKEGKVTHRHGRPMDIPTAPKQARYYVTEKMDETQKLVLKGSTKKVLLQEIAKWHTDEDCNCGNNSPEAPCCGGTGKKFHECALRAQEVLDARFAGYDDKIYKKLLQAGRFHADFNVIGALSSRMSGSGGLNAQGIKAEKKVRRAFPLAFSGYVLCGGDFEGFEVTLAEAVYKDPQLRRDLQSGKKIHALFGTCVYPSMSYEDILAHERIYKNCKSAVFALFYGGEGYTLKDRLGVDLETADKAFLTFCKKYPMVGISQKKVTDMFQSMIQPGGIGTKVIWKEPADKIESLFGHARYFTLENMICKTLFQLANKPPDAWKSIKIKVQRRERVQTAMGAVQSALYGCAFTLQSANVRAAKNHVIQASGAQITKRVQRKIWDLQPVGIHDFLVCPMNVHDEILCPTRPEAVDRVKEIVDNAVEEFRPTVPLIKMDWKIGLKTWADKS